MVTVQAGGGNTGGALENGVLLGDASSTDCAWSTDFVLAGPDDRVSVMTAFDDGSGPALYAGGHFRRADGVVVKHVARWDGASWSPLEGPAGTGTDGPVYALAVFDDGAGPALFVGGEFTTAGGLPAANLARWDGTTWSPAGGPSGGTDGWVSALAAYDDGSGEGLYIGGYFEHAGGTTVNNIVRWDGLTWSALSGPDGVGTSGSVRALGAQDLGNGLELFVGGRFASAGGVTVNGVVRWNGSDWEDLSGPEGVGEYNWVADLTFYDDGSGPGLYIVGHFSSAGDTYVRNVARWDAEGWSALTTPSGGTGTGYICNEVAVYDDGNGAALYVGGRFFTAGGAPVRRIARWDGTSWSPLVGPAGLGTNGSVYGLAVFDDSNGERLYVGGDLIGAGGIPAHHIARWDGTDWSALEPVPLGEGINGRVVALTAFDDGTGPALYAAGWITAGGGVPLGNIGRWDGVSWHPLEGPLENGTDGSIYALAVYDDGTGPALYAGGSFTGAGGLLAHNVARWDGSTWWPLADASGIGTDEPVYALAAYDDGTGPALYVAGDFSKAGGQDAASIARWDGLVWSPVSDYPQYIDVGIIQNLVVHNDGSGEALYAAGYFGRIGGVEIDGVARWDGVSWSSIEGENGGLGSGSVMESLTSYDSGTGPILVATGTFQSADGHPANGLAQWDGSSWWPLAGPDGDGTDGEVLAASVVHDREGRHLVVGGTFSKAGGVAAPNIARWDGVEWSAFPDSDSSGIDARVSALAELSVGGHSSLFVGGSFGAADGIASTGIAAWECMDEDIFSDGFESGDVSAWSGSVSR